MVVIGALVLIAQLYFLWLIGRREDDMQLPEVAPAQPPPAEAAKTKRLGGGDEIVFDTFIQEKAKEEGGCAICLVEYKDGETLAAITVCKHRCVSMLFPWSSEREIIAPIHTNNPRPLTVVFETFGNKEEGGAHGGGCAICLEEYKYGDALAGITACKHRYHVACIKAWLVNNDTCPICRSTNLV
ncbi:PREDICTED: putative RING-H2 finger protein ATL21C [Erythranthe guttata]|uniref:putative RING-H2 finger protein ATL21C n=1 Tax=Erythranthe guttata TaxID=4155 RepID=UPI00064DA0A8|nr:PREDICTED: putative RING-H2 finger protein ATL21C [Erythranthe guttata]|eukprot:XP_012827746.1 PREDICTED: putative RING-H2 finger protein ATL21C [Erythranthe guttata]